MSLRLHRHVQVTSTNASNLQSEGTRRVQWRAWQLLEIPGFVKTSYKQRYHKGVNTLRNFTRTESINPDNNIYFFSVQLSTDATGTGHLIGLFPGRLNGRCGTFLTTSKDGVRWERPRLLVLSSCVGPRIDDNVVGVWPPTSDGSTNAHLYLMRGISYWE